jgi:DNA ligase (NAD+)
VHHYAMVKERGVGKGAIVKLVRSGLVIPKIEAVLQSVEPDIPESCPSCGTHLVWDGDHLVCTNTTDCPAQAENTLIHFFQTLGNIDGFGPKVIEKLHAQGLNKIHEIYALDAHRLQEMGFGEKTAANLVQQLLQSRALPIEDWRFLAAFGVPRLGVGNCERMLQHCRLEDVFTLTVDDLTNVDGFAQLSAEVIIEGLGHIKAEFALVFALGFTLDRTALASDQIAGTSPIAGLIVVFTGTMVQGSRPDMEKQARKLGAKVAKSVTSQADFLITGDKVGARKITDAQEKGVRILSEAEYLDLLRND